MPMNRAQLHRLVRIVDELRAKRYPNARTLAEKLEVTSRTIHRDLDVLRDDWHAPLEFDRRRNGYYLADPGWQPPVGAGLARLGAGEALALVLSLQALEAVRAHGLEDAFRALLQRLPELLPDQVTVDLASLAHRVSFFFEPARGDPEAVGERLGALRAAIEACRVVRLRYYTASRDQETTRLVEPYHLRYYDGAWYVAGFCRWRQDVRTFAVDRIREIQVLAETFPPPTPDRFSPDVYFGEAWRLQRGAERQKVVVRFHPPQARYVRGRTWHPSQESREEQDGSLVLSFRVLGTEEIMRWLLQFGAGVEVLEPASLREAMVAEVEAMARLYR
ncbi:helix-turn-helix transcriptional regulator [Thermaerobacter subterraneus]|uniref:Transcriptional regulator n=1 Tax=Thermaerobacter subterraneus DSM 13965 TaxID=867903 RepID=K6QF30_9FIRM|nr:transcriptional regulator [Thermaerobacter subterraneus]EKP95531.1 putative transcriptional regulator [Thermaerobacter subterraneus DSM 13965]